MQSLASELYRRIFWVTFALIIQYSLSAQEPYHFMLGADELSGFDIYGINQDEEGVYWITSDKGLTSYDGYTFKQYENDKQVSSSLFNPTLNHAGELFCNNLGGQIFKVRNDSLILFHTIPDSLLSAYVNFDFLSNDELIVSSASSYRVKADKLVLLGENMKYGQGSLYREDDGSLIFQNNQKSIARITATDFSEAAIDMNSSDQYLFKFFRKKGKLYGLERGGEVYRLDTVNEHSLSAKKVLDKQESYSRIYATNKNLWVASDKYGLYSIQYPEEGQFSSQLSKMLFENYFISFAFEDRNGNVLLGTFNDGIIVIPETNMQNITVPNDVKISEITTDQSGGVFFGTLQGRIYHWTENDLELIKSEGTRIVEKLEYYPDNHHLFYDNKVVYVYNTQTQQNKDILFTALKDMVQMSQNEYAFGNFSTTRIIRFDDISVVTSRSFETGRVRQLVFNNKTKDLLVNTTKDLFKIDSSGVMRPLNKKMSNYLISDMEQDDTVTFIATRKQGLLKLLGDRIYPFLDDKSGLIDNDVRQIAIQNERLYVATETGFQVFTTAGELVKTISATDGLASIKIQDFAVDKYFIWFLTQFGLQRYDLNSKEDVSTIPIIKKIDIYRDGERVLDSDYSFSNDTDAVTVKISAPSLTLQSDLKYIYRLSENTSWSENDYTDNEIRFLALAPGKYAFQVRLMHKGEFLDERVLKFTIAQPFWNMWWFYTVTVFLFLSVFFTILKFRLRKQEKRNEEVFELNASKLTALQSQMNPHFLFNALNSIQEYIMHNDRRVAGKYLGKFAKLMRMYLDHSRKKSISMKEELDVLALYLQLEELRFENTLTFDISIEDTVDLDIQIPSMFIQPYVENALKHGLFHKTSDRKLTISVIHSLDSKEVICKIEDNGIGRKKSREINKMRAGSHLPFATTANTRRLELLNLHRKRHIRQKTEDLSDPMGLPSGTRVEIVIPIDKE